VKKSLLRKNFFLLCLAFVLTAIAPLRAIALPSAEISAVCSMAESHSTMDCCKVEKTCCCSPAPVEPGNLESGVQSNQSAKFIAIRGTARPVITDWLSCSPAELQDLNHQTVSNQALVNPQPLYILKRSLLI
jgi:hypothetical protein